MNGRDLPVGRPCCAGAETDGNRLLFGLRIFQKPAGLDLEHLGTAGS